MKIVINKITTLESPDKVIKIYDRSGLFYYFRNNTDQLHRFTMPRGEYHTKNTVKKSDKQIVYNMELPIPEGYRRLPSKFIVKYARNKNKCSVFPTYFPDAALIIFDHSFKKYPNFVTRYVLYHELGHFFYFGKGNISEMKCDTFANFCMLKTGFNPSQCYLANQFVLSNVQGKRKKLNHLLNKKNGIIERQTV